MKDTSAVEYADYLAAKAEHYCANPPEAPEGFELVECDAEPRHWPYYTVKDDDFYPAHCPDCSYASLQDELRSEERKFHWLKHPIRGKWASKVVHTMYSLGIIASSTHTWSHSCSNCITRVGFRGHRRYVLGVADWQWNCIFRGHHFPGVPMGMLGCGKCAPCPSCETVTWDHSKGCDYE